MSSSQTTITEANEKESNWLDAQEGIQQMLRSLREKFGYKTNFKNYPHKNPLKAIHESLIHFKDIKRSSKTPEHSLKPNKDITAHNYNFLLNACKRKRITSLIRDKR